MFLNNSLHRAAQVRGGCIASVHEGRVLTWTQMRDEVARQAGTLRALGIQRGDRVALLGLNTDRFLQAVLAVSWLGAVAVPMKAATSAAARALRSVVPETPGASAVVIRPRQGSFGWPGCPVQGLGRLLPSS